jgi:hypothetical protein
MEAAQMACMLPILLGLHAQHGIRLAPLDPAAHQSPQVHVQVAPPVQSKQTVGV